MPSFRQARVKPDELGDIYFDYDRVNGFNLTFGIEGGGTDEKSFGVDITDPTLPLYAYGIYPFTNIINAAPITTIGTTILLAPFVNASASNNSGPIHSIATVIPGPPLDEAEAVSSLTRSLVGHPIMVYSIPQIVQVTYPASTAFRGYFMDNYSFNRTDFRMIRGVQNEINFYVRDVDRKPVTLGNTETLTINITDPATNILLMSRNLTTIDSTQGIYLLTVFATEMEAWPTIPCRWSLAYNRADGSTVLMWTDRGYSPYSTVTITEGPVPGPATTVTVLWDQFSLLSDNNYYSPALAGSATYGFTGGVQTFVITMTNLIGEIRIDASLDTAPVDDDTSSDWFEVDSVTYDIANTATIVLNEVGNYLWMRVVFLPGEGNTGTINQFEYKS